MRRPRVPTASMAPPHRRVEFQIETSSEVVDLDGIGSRLLKSNRLKYELVVATWMGPLNPPARWTNRIQRMARPGRVTAG